MRLALLCICAALAFLVRLFPIVHHESDMQELDPYFNYRATVYLAENGFSVLKDGFDGASWFPLGRHIGGEVYPGLMWTAASICYTLDTFVGAVQIRDICVFIGPAFASLTALVAYCLGTEVKGHGTGLVAALLVAIMPGFTSRSVAGAFDNEVVGVFAMLLTFLFFLKAAKTGSMAWAVASSLTYFHMVACWSGYVFVTNLLPLYVLLLIFISRDSRQLHTAYLVYHVLGTLFAVQIRVVGFAALWSSDHLLAHSVFCVLLLRLASQRLGLTFKPEFCPRFLLADGTGAIAAVAAAMLGAGTATGYFSPWSGRLVSMMQPGFTMKHMPLVASVAEHQPTTWCMFFYDLHLICFMYPLGMYHSFKSLSDSRIFLVLYGLTSLYCASATARLMLLFAPAAALMAAIGISETLSTHATHIQTLTHAMADKSSSSKKESGQAARARRRLLSGALPIQREFSCMVLLGVGLLLCAYVRHCTWCASKLTTADALPSAVHTATGPAVSPLPAAADGEPLEAVATAAIRTVALQDFHEAHSWLRTNTAETTVVAAWCDYGYQITSMANRTDNAAWNSTRIASVGLALALPELEAHEVLRHGMEADYVLVVFGGLSGFRSDDVSKFPWMLRIAAEAFPANVTPADYLADNTQLASSWTPVVDRTAPKAVFDSLLYKLS